MIDWLFDNYYNGFALTFVFGILIYIFNINKCKESIGVIQFFISNGILSIVWFLSVPATIVISTIDMFKPKKAN